MSPLQLEYDHSVKGQRKSIIKMLICVCFIREVKLGAKLAIKMRGKETSISSSEGVVRKFYYDYSFWSFDRLRGDYSDQEAVYNQVAAPLLDQAFKGYNTCLFAYGQVSVVNCSQLLTL